LQTVLAPKTKVTKAGVAELRKEMPSINIACD
jgi:hypothetical protein